MTLILKTLAWLKGLQVAYLLSFLSYKLGKYIHNKFSHRFSKAIVFLKSDYFLKFLTYEIFFYFMTVISLPLIAIGYLKIHSNVYPQLEPIILLIDLYTPAVIRDLASIIVLIQEWQFNYIVILFDHIFKAGESHALYSMDLFMSITPLFVTVRHASTKATRKTTIQKNMVTLKSLKEELDAIKSKHAAVASHTITNDAKGNQTIKTRWSVNPLALMTIISFILTYGAKLPYVSNIVKMLALWYGRRGWWKLLVRFRSGFLYLNAFIGVMWICDVVGFGPTNILAGLTGLGPAYLDIITNTYKTIHNWIFGLFDTKVVPDVPNNPPYKWWEAGGVSPKMAGIDITNPLLEHMHTAKEKSLREIYMNHKPDITINNYSSSWGSLYNWLWYGGVGLISAGVAFIAYKFFTDSAFVQDLLGTSTPAAPTAPKGPIVPRITVTDPEGAEGGAAGTSGSNIGIFALALGRKIINLPNNILSALNPLNYITSARAHDIQHANFLERQRNLHVQDRTKWPFQEDNPYFPWYKKLRIYLFHESEDEKTHREHMLRVFEGFVDSSEDGSSSGSNTPGTRRSGSRTPVLRLRSDEGYFEQVRTRALKLKMKQLDSLMEQAAIKTKNAVLPMPTPLELEVIRNSVFDASNKAASEFINNHGGLLPDETEFDKAVTEAVANALHSDGMKGIFKYYTDLLAQSRPGTPRSQSGAGPSGGAGDAGVDLSSVWSQNTQNTQPQSGAASKSVTPIYGARTPISPSLLSSGGSFSGWVGGITPIPGESTPPINAAVSSELLIEKLNKLESVKGKLKTLDLVDKFDTLSSEIDKASKEIRRKLIERNVLKDDATLALIQAKKELELEVLRLKEMLAEQASNTGENNTNTSENVDKSSENIDKSSENVDKSSENVSQSSKRPSVRTIKNEYGEDVIEHDIKGKKK